MYLICRLSVASHVALNCVPCWLNSSRFKPLVAAQTSSPSISPVNTHSLYAAALSGDVNPKPSREAAAFLKPANAATSTPSRLYWAETSSPVFGSLKDSRGIVASYQVLDAKFAGSVLVVSTRRKPGTTAMVFLVAPPSSLRTTSPPPLAPPNDRSISILLNRTLNSSELLGVSLN